MTGRREHHVPPHAVVHTKNYPGLPISGRSFELFLMDPSARLSWGLFTHPYRDLHDTVAGTRSSRTWPATHVRSETPLTPPLHAQDADCRRNPR